MSDLNKLFTKYKSQLEVSLNGWMKENGYKEVKVTDEVVVDLLDELLSVLSSKKEMESVMDEINKDDMLEEYDWCESLEE